MALQLTKKTKGIDANYWKIVRSTYDAMGNQTRVTLALYYNKISREENINDFIEVKDFYLEGFLTQAEMYVKIKKSSTGERVVKSAITEGEFPNVKVITPAVTEEYETNEFVDALDV